MSSLSSDVIGTLVAQRPQSFDHAMFRHALDAAWSERVVELGAGHLIASDSQLDGLARMRAAFEAELREQN